MVGSGYASHISAFGNPNRKNSSFWDLGELYSRHKLLSLLELLIEHDRNHVCCLIGSSVSHGRDKSKCGDTDSIGK